MGLFGRFRKSESTRPATDAPQSSAELVRAEASRLISPGFRTRAQVREEMIDLFEDEGLEMFGDGQPLSRDEIAAIVDDVWAERLRAQQTWFGLSDADRLESAFAELEASGIVARMNFSCCGSCGHAEIAGEVAEDRSPRGYVFFHMQDADALVEADAPSLYFDYGAWSGDGGPYPDRESYAAAAVAIGHDIVHTLGAAGLRVEWNGDLGRRICVVGLDWRRRLSA